jgi:homocitrate synthase NifV
MKNAVLIDTTLRDGAQAPDTVLNRKDRVRIAQMLVELGVPEIEVGIPSMGGNEQSVIRAITRAVGSRCRINLWCRAYPADLVHAARCGNDTVHIAFPVSNAHLASIDMNERWLFNSLERMIHAGLANFRRVTVGCQDASRAPLDRVIAFVRMATSAGAARVRIADTVGILTPLSTLQLLTSIRNAVQHADLDFHAHNDLGMATANAVTALSSGVAAVSVTMGGIGERAGNAALEEVAMGIAQTSPGLKLGINNDLLVPFCTELATMLRKGIHERKPITGAKVFTHESGIHCHAIRKNPATFEPFNPAIVGHSPRAIVGGTHSGSAGIQWLLKEQGIDISRADARTLCARVRKTSMRKKRSLLPKDIKKLYQTQSMKS